MSRRLRAQPTAGTVSAVFIVAGCTTAGAPPEGTSEAGPTNSPVPPPLADI
jgi:hypothetical protein